MRKVGTLKRKEIINEERGILNFFVKGVVSVERLEREKEAAYRLQILWLRNDISKVCFFVLKAEIIWVLT